MSSTNSLSVLFSLSGDQNKASSRVRGFWVAEAFEESGVRCNLRWGNSKGDLLNFALGLRRHDAIVFQKTYSRYHRWLMWLARLLGKQTYLDLDDAPSRTQSPVTLKNIEAMMRMADGVFVGNQNLFNYAKKHQSSVHLVPSGINLKHYQVFERGNDGAPVCLGWVGNGAHYKRDLIDILVQPLREIAAKHSVRLKLVGACGERELYDVFGAIAGLEIDFVDSIEWSDPNEVSRAIQDFDIGLYPLLPNDFNQYKCGFKALEYMATGIPVVSSPVAINADMICDGEDGLLADSIDEWVSALSRLIESTELRKKMGRKGRSKVESSFNVVKIAEQIKSILDENHRTSLSGVKP